MSYAPPVFAFSVCTACKERIKGTRVCAKDGVLCERCARIHLAEYHHFRVARRQYVARHKARRG